MDYQSRIALEPGKRSGKPTIRSLRITVYDVLRLLATVGNGLRKATSIPLSKA
jgi:uncharacterized protein (DUF433 family)